MTANPFCRKTGQEWGYATEPDQQLSRTEGSPALTLLQGCPGKAGTEPIRAGRNASVGAEAVRTNGSCLFQLHLDCMQHLAHWGPGPHWGSQDSLKNRRPIAAPQIRAASWDKACSPHLRHRVGL